MAVSSEIADVAYTGNGTQTVFPVPFYFLADADLTVTLVSDATGSELQQVLGLQYSVSGAGAASGGTVTMATAPAIGQTLTIERGIPLTQTTTFQRRDPFDAQTVNADLDRARMVDQRIKRRLDLTLRAPVSEPSPGPLPGKASRLHRVLTFDEQGQPAAGADGRLLPDLIAGYYALQPDIAKVAALDNEAALAALAPPAAQTLTFLRGRGAGQPSRGGLWYYDTTSTENPTTGTAWRVIRPDAKGEADTGRHHRIVMGAVDIAGVFGFVGDGATNNAAAMQRLEDALNASGLLNFDGYWAPGTYRIDPDAGAGLDGLLNVSSASLYTLSLSGPGKLLFGATAAMSQRMLLVGRTTVTAGSSVSVSGLTMGLSIPSQRIGHADMLSLRGFDNFLVKNCCILDAHNMGIVINRNVATYLPSSIQILDNVIGTALDRANDSHGAIGDTGIWAVNSANLMIRGNTIRHTGDDAIAVVENEIEVDDPYTGSGTVVAEGATITDNDISHCQGYAIKVCIPGCIVANNRIKRTLNSGIGIYHLLNTNPVQPHSCRIVNNDIREVGWLVYTEIGLNQIILSTSAGIELLYAGNDNKLLNNSIDGCRGSAISVSTLSGYDTQRLTIDGLDVRRCGELENGSPLNTQVALFTRTNLGGSAQTGTLKYVNIRNVRARNIQAPLVQWFHNGTNDEGYVLWDGGTLTDSTLHSSFLASGQAKSWFHLVEASTGDLKQMEFRGLVYRRVTGGTQVVRAPTMSLAELTIYWSDEYADYRWDPLQILASGSEARLDGYRELVYKRTAVASTTMLALPAEYSYLIVLKSLDASNTGAHWEGYFDAASNTVVTTDSATGGGSTAFNVSYDSGTDAVLIQGGGASFGAQAVITRIVAGLSVVVS